MDTTLPQSVRLRLSQALDQWSHWRDPPSRRPELLETLSRTSSNVSLRVGTQEHSWVLRVDGFAPQRLGLSRDAEWRALNAAAAAGFAPPAVYRNPDLGVLVCRYLPPDPADGQSLQAIATLLRRIHALPPLKYRLDPRRRALRYLELAGGTLSPELDAAMGRCAPADRSCLCHNDLLRANRLQHRGRLLALDWEYAAMGDPLFDLAVIIEGDGLSDSEAATLHEYWLQAAPGAADAARLEDQRTIYRGLAPLWAAAMAALRN